jgi:hypothetical protein
MLLTFLVIFFRYDCEEHSTMFDRDNSMYLGDESSYKKREVQMPKKLVSSLSVQVYYHPDYFIITFIIFDSRLGHLREL